MLSMPGAEPPNQTHISKPQSWGLVTFKDRRYLPDMAIRLTYQEERKRGTSGSVSIFLGSLPELLNIQLALLSDLITS